MADVIINDLRPRTQIVQTAELAADNRYDFGFPITASTDLKVAIDDAIVDPGEYTVSGVGSATGGHITFATLSPAVDSRITLWRDMPFQRLTDFEAQEGLTAGDLNNELDRAALLLQQAEALVGDSVHRRPYDVEQELILPTVTERAGKYLSFDDNGVPEAVNARILGDIESLALVYQGPRATAPTKRLDGTDLRDGDLYFDTTTGRPRSYASGNWTDTTSLSPSPFMSGLLDDADAAAARSTLGLGTAAALDAGTSGDNVVQLDSMGRLPALDGSALTNLVGTDMVARDLAIEALWRNAMDHAMSNQASFNTYLDVFTDETGVNGPVYRSGASFFDGSTASSVTFDSALSSTANPFSMIATVRVDSMESGSRATIVHMGGFMWELFLYTPTSAMNLCAHFPGIGAIAPTSTDIAFGTKYHVAICHAGGAIDNGGNTKWYINGVENTGRSGLLTNIISLSSTAFIGRSAASAFYDFDGVIAEFGVWNNQLNAMEVVALYNNGGSPLDPRADGGYYASSANLVHYFPFDEGSGGATLDRVTSESATFSNPGWETGFVASTTRGSTNQVYNAAEDHYENPSSVGTMNLVPAMANNLEPSGTVSGTVSGSFSTEADLYRVFDGAPTIVEATSMAATYDFGSSREVGGYSVTVNGEGLFRYPTAWTISGSNDGTTWTSLDTRAGQSWVDEEKRSFEMAVQGSFRYLRYTLSSHSGSAAQIREIEYFGLVRPTMTVESVPVTCDAAPTELRALVDIQPLEQALVNTDIMVEVSRDGGSTYTAGTLQKVSTDVAEVDGRGVWSATIDVSGQPDGANARLRLRAMNNKGVVLHRWALQGDTPLSL